MASDIADASPRSALHDNIESKGDTSYYYAHADHPAREKLEGELARSFGGEPALLRTVSGADSPRPRARVIEKYAWADEDEKLKIYVPLDGIGAHGADNISLQHTASSVELRVANWQGADHVLLIPQLHAEISAATHRVRGDKIIVTLTKVEAIKWWQLKKRAD